MSMGNERLDEELVSLAGSDPDAFEELYRRTVGKVTGFAVRRCRTPEDVADLVALHGGDRLRPSLRPGARRGAPVVAGHRRPPTRWNAAALAA